MFIGTKLDVPYEEKDEVKKLGAKWDPLEKTWYVPEGLSLECFEEWIPEPEPSHIYLIAGERNCFKCGKKTPVCGFAVSFPEDEGCKEIIHILSLDAVEFSTIPGELRQFMKGRFGIRRDFSQVMNASTNANHCVHCGVIQGNFYVFMEVEPPFFVDSVDAARSLRLFELPGVLKNGIKADFGCCGFAYPGDEYITEHTPRIATLDSFGSFN